MNTNVVYVNFFRIISLELWPVEGEQTYKQTDGQTDKITVTTNILEKNQRFSQVINWQLSIEHEFLDLESSDMDK